MTDQIAKGSQPTNIIAANPTLYGFIPTVEPRERVIFYGSRPFVAHWPAPRAVIALECRCLYSGRVQGVGFR